MAFAAKMIEGELFPKFACDLRPPTTPCSSFGDLINHYGPDEALDYAKVLLWGFIAGFSERLVPDALQTFAKREASVANRDVGDDKAPVG
jgi:hypothetical protein